MCRQLLVKIITIKLFVFLFYTAPIGAPELMVGNVTNSAVEFQVQSRDDMTDALISGYEVIRFGVPMIGTAYYNSGRVMGLERISPAVPGAQYRITAWALDTGGVTRSLESKVKSATTGEAGECDCMVAALMLIL